MQLPLQFPLKRAIKQLSMMFQCSVCRGEREMEKNDTFDAEYRGCSHVHRYSSQWIFHVVQGKGL